MASLGLLNRKIKTVNAVDGISFDVKKGELFGLLGPNGAGKTTTVKMLTTLLIPTSGSARIADMDIVRDAEKIRSHIGFIFGGERWSGTLPYLFGTPANRMTLFLGRAFMYIFDGMLGVFIGLAWGILLFKLDLSRTDLPALTLTIFITTFSTAGLGLLMGCLSLITRNLMVCKQYSLFLAVGFFRSQSGYFHPPTLDAGGFKCVATHSWSDIHPCSYRRWKTG